MVDVVTAEVRDVEDVMVDDSCTFSMNAWCSLTIVFILAKSWTT